MKPKSARYRNAMIAARMMAVIIATVVLASGSEAQNMAEYSNLSATAAKSLKEPVGTRPIAPLTQATKSASGNSPVVWEDKNAQHKDNPVAKPDVPAVFILSNGERVESARYLLTVDSLQVQQGETQRTIPLSAINLNATIAANHERGLDLKVPTNKSQITLGF